MCTLHQELGQEEENGVKADSAADDNSQQSAAAAELFRKINDFFNPILKWVSTMDNSEKVRLMKSKT